MYRTFGVHLLPWLALNESPLPLPVAAGRAGFGEEFRRSSAGGSQTTVLQRQLPQPATVHP